MAVKKEQLKTDLKSCISNLKDRADVIEGTVDQPLRDILIQENVKKFRDCIRTAFDKNTEIALPPKDDDKPKDAPLDGLKPIDTAIHDFLIKN